MTDNRTTERVDHPPRVREAIDELMREKDATDNRTTEKQCEYCDGSKKPITTEIDGEAHITLTPDDYEYPEGFMLDVYDEKRTNNDGDKLWLFSFTVPCCPMCGRRLKAGDTR